MFGTSYPISSKMQQLTNVIILIYKHCFTLHFIKVNHTYPKHAYKYQKNGLDVVGHFAAKNKTKIFINAKVVHLIKA